MTRFKMVEGSVSAHCCFEATVVDTSTTSTTYGGKFKTVCECFDTAAAELIAALLNAAAERGEL